MSRLIDADALKRKAQRVATESWKMGLTARIETTLNQFIDWIDNAPTVQPEPTQEIQDILDYLDTVLHPIVSPEHWDVYSRLHDMVSSLPSAQPKYEPVTAEDFAKVMSESTIYGFMAWYGEVLALMKRMGFVICKKT